MADAFGVTEEYMDTELCRQGEQMEESQVKLVFRFITSGRLHAKIDKVGGNVVTYKPDSKNGQTCIKQGDIFLNR